MKDLKQIQEFFSKPLNENVFVEAFKLQKALKGMGYDVKVKAVDDFGKNVFEDNLKKVILSTSISLNQTNGFLPISALPCTSDPFELNTIGSNDIVGSIIFSIPVA